MNQQSEYELALDYLGGQLSADETARLYRRLVAEPKLARNLLHAASDESVIAEWVRTRRLWKSAAPNHRSRSKGLRQHWKAISVVLSLAATVLFAGWMLIPSSGPRHDATIVRLIDARFVKGSSAEVGRRLSAGDRVRISAGSVEIAYRNGARVLLEAPADFRVIDDNTGRLTRGTLSADADKVQGFRIETPSGTVTDLGTRFAVSVKDDRTTEVEVLQGKVRAEVRTAADKPREVELVKGSAALIDAVKNQARKMAGGLPVFDDVKQLLRQKTVEAVADHYVCGGEQADRVQSATKDPGMLLKRDPWRRLGVCRKAYIRFDLAGEKLAGDGGATFTFRHANDNSPGSKHPHFVGTLGVHAIKRGQLSGTELAWRENSLTWNNAPANNKSDASALTNQAELIGRVEVNAGPGKAGTSAGTSYSINVPHLADYVQPDGSVTFVITVLEQKSFDPVLYFVQHESPDYAGPLLTFSSDVE